MTQQDAHDRAARAGDAGPTAVRGAGPRTR